MRHWLKVKHQERKNIKLKLHLGCWQLACNIKQMCMFLGIFCFLNWIAKLYFFLMTTTNFWSVNNFKCPFYNLLYSNFICSLSPLSDIMIGETFAAASKVFHFLSFFSAPPPKLNWALLISWCVPGDWFLEIILGSLGGILPFQVYVYTLLPYKFHVGIWVHKLTYIVVLCLCGQL